MTTTTNEIVDRVIATISEANFLPAEDVEWAPSFALGAYTISKNFIAYVTLDDETIELYVTNLGGVVYSACKFDNTMWGHAALEAACKAVTEQV